jgi:hypothetical protein
MERRHPFIGALQGSSQPPRQGVPQSDGLILGQCQNARAGNVWIEFDRSAALAHHKIGETHRTAVKRTCRVDEFAVVAGPFRHWYIAGVEGHE